MISPKVIKRSNRRSLALTIDDNGDLIVKAPYKMPLNDIFDYINQKQKWIESRQSMIKSILTKNFDLINYNKMLFLGKEYTVGITKNINEVYITKDLILVNYSKSINNIKQQLKSFLLINFEQVIIPRISFLARKIGVSFNNIKVINSKSKWGMCDSKKCIYINYKLLMLSHEIIDYVLIHELCHLKQMNHSKAFWNSVGKLLPDYKLKREQLKKCNFLIKLF